ncbi:carbon-nitrogen family hydrolase [Bacillus sp. B-jedd]|uniref:carbon-nitrogen family hydrolase n=1 Tax=Bacillus sp. B-jedd TaxID=1476857 RepID=UPI0005156022|nr:carbon-nitrogen family hydrolase [Bacillus sp. B-jedd]CEG26603.1 putative hydrolase [Bacillus sp. B-jedd]
MRMKIAIAQMDIAYGKPGENYLKAEKLIKEAAESNPDCIVLPELWTTGFDLDRLDEIADDQAEQSIAFLEEKAAENKVNLIGGSVANRTGSGVENTLLVVSKDGSLVHKYSKLHLFQLMDEHHYITPGTGTANFGLEGRQFAGFVCYDIRFPEWQRKHAANGAEAIFVVAEWPLARLAHWRALLIARAIENQCYVIACNCVGSNPNNVFAGHSMIIDPWGEVIAEAGEGEEILTGEIDFEKVKEVRGIMPVFDDRRPEQY